VPPMAAFHAFLGWLTVAATIAVMVAALPGAIGLASGRRWIDRAILSQLAAAAASGVAGVAVAVSGRGPREALHFVYAAIVIAALPGARYAVHAKTARPFAAWIAVAALVVMGALLRSFMTGR
jgi:hypothetical protein